MGWKPNWLIVLAAAALGVAAVFLLLPRDSLWSVEGVAPLVLGTADDPFSYDGRHVLPCRGTLEIRVDSDTGRGELSAQLRAEDAVVLALLSGTQTGSRVSVRSRELTLEHVDEAVHGDTGFGGSELPETRAQIAGSGSFDLLVDGDRVGDALPGRWLVAEAVRREDGAVRRGGLIYSPLLRDKTDFADRERLEATLLLMLADGESQGALLLHVVFTDVELAAASAP
jgi:hypothetical protein